MKPPWLLILYLPCENTNNLLYQTFPIDLMSQKLLSVNKHTQILLKTHHCARGNKFDSCSHNRLKVSQSIRLVPDIYHTLCFVSLSPFSPVSTVVCNSVRIIRAITIRAYR